MRNLARPSTSTTVALRLLRARPEDQSVTRQSDSVRAVTVHFSTDGGRTWQVAAVRRAGGAWSAVVRNPASGYVSLRSTVTDAHGGSTTTTVIRAYGID